MFRSARRLLFYQSCVMFLCFPRCIRCSVAPDDCCSIRGASCFSVFPRCIRCSACFSRMTTCFSTCVKCVDDGRRPPPPAITTSASLRTCCSTNSYRWRGCWWGGVDLVMSPCRIVANADKLYILPFVIFHFNYVNKQKVKLVITKKNVKYHDHVLNKFY